ncbi:MAG: hypothetical protein AVDCRST_MAG15-940, partial [uncultured Rubellimicrobium sp.]
AIRLRGPRPSGRPPRPKPPARGPAPHRPRPRPRGSRPHLAAGALWADGPELLSPCDAVL